MKYANELSEYADWLADLANEEVSGEALRSLLATRITGGEMAERAAREVEIARRVRVLLSDLRQKEIFVPADFEARLMSRLSKDVTLLNLLEIYLTGFSGTLVELINALFSLFPEPAEPELSTI